MGNFSKENEEKNFSSAVLREKTKVEILWGNFLRECEKKNFRGQLSVKKKTGKNFFIGNFRMRTVFNAIIQIMMNFPFDLCIFSCQ